MFYYFYMRHLSKSLKSHHSLSACTLCCTCCLNICCLIVLRLCSIVVCLVTALSPCLSRVTLVIYQKGDVLFISKRSHFWQPAFINNLVSNFVYFVDWINIHNFIFFFVIVSEVCNAGHYANVCCRTCDQCITDTDCGFCYIEAGAGLAVNGSCLSALHDDKGDVLFRESAYGRCHQSMLHKPLHWAYDFCPTNFAWMATFGLVLYLMCFAPGSLVSLLTCHRVRYCDCWLAS